MAFDPVTAILNLGNTVLDRVLPDKAQNDAAKAQLAMLTVKGEFDTELGQLQVDQAEAGSKSVFVAGWRPFIGWALGFVLIYAFIAQPLIQFILVACHSTFDINKLPKLDYTELWPILLGMLGMGAMRSYDKTQGTDNGH